MTKKTKIGLFMMITPIIWAVLSCFYFGVWAGLGFIGGVIYGGVGMILILIGGAEDDRG